ncbi:hypothetical protein [Streptosporangium sp. NBC_01756]|uniref:hypothetical protein n=1 Tax=Streptosporangium sp. NBC_01756 TaxID=2975950 RepID=UPI002DD8DE10|nr:hypothetical protein [Streptosporangium sp. NBC_01756]WSC86549.1 hypothetical protein OIE48_40445 [Streptosporangium sp. NBC_01756]
MVPIEDVNGDEPEEVDVLAVAGGDERQEFVRDLAELADRLPCYPVVQVITALVSR